MSLADGIAWERDNPRICPGCYGHVRAEWFFGSRLKRCECKNRTDYGELKKEKVREPACSDS